jgi:hypothetical protein
MLGRSYFKPISSQNENKFLHMIHSAWSTLPCRQHHSTFFSQSRPTMPENTDSSNIYRFTVSPQPNSNMCFSFIPVSTGEIVSLSFLFFPFASGMTISDDRHHCRPSAHHHLILQSKQSPTALLLVFIIGCQAHCPTLFSGLFLCSKSWFSKSTPVQDLPLLKDRTGD